MSQRESAVSPKKAGRINGKRSKADMVQIAGGRFMMGDKDQVDAAPHEVMVSSFYIDKYLVTQESIRKRWARIHPDGKAKKIRSSKCDGLMR